MIIQPQEGFQKDFMINPADIVIGGGAAGAGKTFSLLIEGARFGHLPKYQAAIFRRLTTMIPASLWLPSENLYNYFRPKPRGVPNKYEWWFSETSRLKFTHLQYDKDALSHQGAEYAFIGFDELTHFTSKQFWYLTSRNRTTCGIKPYIRATCNPESAGWVKNLVKHYIYPDDYHIEELQGMPIKEMRGKVLFFKRDGDNLFWGNSKKEIIQKYPELFDTNEMREGEKLGIKKEDFITSFSFIGGSVFENKELLKVNSGYLSNLSQLSPEMKSQLLKGCWKRLDSEDILFKYDSLEKMYENSFIKETENSIHRYITADIALEGADKFVIMVWDGYVLIKIISIDKSNGSEVINIIQKAAKDFGVPINNICFDAAGVGGFLGGFFKNSYSFVGNSSPLLGENYSNLRTQCYYKMSILVNDNKVFIKDKNYSEYLIKELDMTRKVPHVFGKLKIESKDIIKQKINGLPDFADCFSMRAVFDYKKQIVYKPRVISV